MLLSRLQQWARLLLRKRPAQRRPGASARLLLECLEGRTLPSTVTWINPGGGDWDTASNWLDADTGTNHVPTANDDAVIGTSGITVTHSSFFNSDKVNSLTSQATLVVSAGSLTFNTPSTTQALTLSNGTVTVAAPDPTNPGSLEVATLTESGGTLTGPGTVTVDNALLWTGGSMSGSGATEVLTQGKVGGASPFGLTLSGRTLDNFGTFTVDSNSTVVFGSNATLNNQSGAQLVLKDSAGLGSFFGSSGTVNNAGTLTEPGLPGSISAVDVTHFDNTGTVDVQGGTLNVPAGMTNEGTLAVASGAVANITGGNSSGDFALQAAGHLTLTGNFTLLNGSTTELGAAAQMELDGATLQGGAAVTGKGSVTVGGFSGQMAVSNGAVTIDNLIVNGGTVTLNSNASLQVGTLTQSGGTLTGPGPLTIANSLVWTGGTMTGPGATEVQGKGEVGGGSPFGPTLSGRTLDNFGTTTVDNNSNLLFASNATFNNQAGSQLVLQGTANLGNFFGSSGKLNNAGTLVRSGLTSTSTVNIAFDNTGTVKVQEGTLNFPNGMTSEGTLILKPGAVASITGGSSSGAIKLRAGSHLNLGGTFTLLNGSTTHAGKGSQLELDGTVTQQGGATVTLANNSLLNVAPGFSFGGQNYILASGATVSGNGTVLLNGFSSLLTVNGAASVSNLILNNGTITVSGSNNLEVNNLTQSGGILTGSGKVTIDGQWNWIGGNMTGTGQTVVNGTGSVGNNFFGTILDTRTVNNNGTVTLPDGDAIRFQNKSAWNNLAGSTLILGNGSSLGSFFGNSGTLTNAGLIEDTGPASNATIGLNSTVSNSGTISLQGVLNLSGAYTQTAGGTLSIVLTSASPAVNGELKVNGQATLNGTLSISTASGFTPSAGQVFTILTSSGFSGDFSNFSGLDLGNGLTLTPSHNSTSYILTVTAS